MGYLKTFHATFLVIFWCLYIFKGICCVKITKLTMPRWVQNGTEDSVILDCEYEISERDKRLVVKWFLNEDPEPIYQWIPELQSRHASARLLGKLNMDYTVSPATDQTRYRALNILRPTTDLSGRYSCHVDSLASQDTEESVMVVFAPPKKFEFNFTRVSNDAVNLTCVADRVYPLPQLTLYHVTADGVRQLTDTRTMSYKSGGAYRIVVSREVRDRDLPPGLYATFQCNLGIPGTEYEHQRSQAYFPGMGPTDKSSRNQISLVALVLVVIPLAILVS